MVRILGLVLVLAGAAGARADEIRLSLDECLRRALDSALEIREGRLGPPIAATRVTEADSEFDHLLSFRTSGGLSVTPANSFFSGAEEVREQTFDGTVEVQKRLRSTGGTYTVGFTTGDLVTNSRFFNFRPQWTNLLTFGFTQPLLRGGGRAYALSRTRIATADVRGAGAEYRAVLEATLSSVERAYWNLVFLREDLAVKRQSKKVAEELVRVSEKRLEAGAGTRVELVQAEAGAAERETETILAERRLRDAQDDLRAYVRPFTDAPGAELVIVPVDPARAPETPAREELGERLRRAFEERPDLIALRERLEASGIRVVQAESELLPRLDFFGNFGLSGLEDTFTRSTRVVLRSDFTSWQVGLSLEIPLGNRGPRASYRRALLERSRAAASFEKLKNRVIVEVRAALREVETAWREILAARKSTGAARAQFEAERDRLAADKSTNYQLLQVEEDLSRARSRELRAIISYRVALVDLEAATGTYLEARGLTPAEPKERTEPPGPARSPLPARPGGGAPAGPPAPRGLPGSSAGRTSGT